MVRLELALSSPLWPQLGDTLVMNTDPDRLPRKNVFPVVIKTGAQFWGEGTLAPAAPIHLPDAG